MIPKIVNQRLRVIILTKKTFRIYEKDKNVTISKIQSIYLRRNFFITGTEPKLQFINLQ